MHDRASTTFVEDGTIEAALSNPAVGFGRALDSGRILSLAQRRVMGPRVALEAPPRRWARSPLGAAAIALVILVPAVALLGTVGRPGIRTLAASWAYNYGTIEELAASSDLVVLGAPTSVVREDNLPALGYPQTIFDVRLDRVIKGDATGVIRVLQDGGLIEDDRVVVELEGFPLMAANDEALLFLRPIQRDGETLWVIVGGPQGLFHVTNDQVRAWSDESAVTLPEPATVDAVAGAVTSAN